MTKELANTMNNKNIVQRPGNKRFPRQNKNRNQKTKTEKVKLINLNYVINNKHINLNYCIAKYTTIR